jgi:ribonuclease P protein component
MGEAHLSTEQSSSGQEARVPSSDEHPRRSGNPEVPAGQGPLQAVGIIDSLRGRGDFRRLRAEGRRWSSGPVWCIYRPDEAPEPSRAAFAIGRSVGNAVVRNRVRRRMREILRVCSLPAGDFLFGISPAGAGLPFDQLRSHVVTVIDRCRPTESR